MSFINKFKRALGFGGDDNDADELLYADTDVAIDSTESAESKDGRSSAVNASSVTQNSDTPLPDFAFDTACRDSIFTFVLEEFNKALPGFISNAVNPEAQRRILGEKLDKGISEYMDSLAKLARLHSESQWKERQSQLTSQLDAVKQRSEDIERRSAEMKQKQLSADRQKRALSERTHDLEAQLARSESEREQFELENRSLVNRLKVAGVVQEDVEKLRSENQTLRAELFKVLHPAEGSKGTYQVPDEILLGTESKAKFEERISELESQLRESCNREEELKKRLDDTIKQLDETSRSLDEHKHIVDNLGTLEDMLTQQDAKIKSQRKTIEKRETEIKELKAIIAEREDEFAHKEKHYQNELAALRPPTVTERIEINFGEVSEEAPRITEADLTAMEASFENGEWFTHNPPAETPSMRDPEADAEFGYKAPRRKASPATNPNQLSLF